MIRVLIEHQGDTIELPAGEVVVGRDLSCQLRLNDPAVSRRHLRLLVGRDLLVLEDLGSHNGTTLNGAVMRGRATLRDGDEVRLGARTLRVKILEATEDDDVLNSATMRLTALRLDDHDTLPGDEPPIVAGPVPDEVAPPRISTHNCPGCRTRVAISADVCPHCGYQWPGALPESVTQIHSMAEMDAAMGAELPPPEEERRSDTRRPVELAVMYTSETLAFDAVAMDLARGGLFVATELLDPVGTPCRITVLADGSPAVSFAGVVRRVVEAPTPEGHPAGLGVKFTAMGADAERWLMRLLASVNT
jgi:hypothetical protein